MGFFLACEDASRLDWSFDPLSSQVKGACRSAMIELALQTKRKEVRRGNTPGVSMFEPAPTFGQIILPRGSPPASLPPQRARAGHWGPRSAASRGDLRVVIMPMRRQRAGN